MLAWKTVVEKKVLEDVNFLNSFFFLKIESFQCDISFYSTELFLQWHEDKDKCLLARGLPNLKQLSNWLIFSFASIPSFQY